MNSTSKRFAKFGALLQTASFLALGNVLTAHAQTPPPMGQTPPEQVLVTGSLIHGAATLGVPVTNLTDQDFKETGSLTVADVLKELPSVTVQLANAINESGGQALHTQSISIHGITSSTASEALMLVDGIRFPPQALSFCTIDPSIIPTIALERVDVLADGASATYGSDALSGVVNLVLKHGFDGAITQLQYGRSTDIGAATYDAQQLYGRKWDSGDVTVSYEFYHIDAVKGPGRSYFTTDYTPFGFQNSNPIGSSMPGVVSTGALKTNAALAANGFSAKTGNIACTNCFSIPAGTGWDFGSQPPGPTLPWSTLLANPGVLNEHNPAQYADILPSADRNAGTITFDQNLFGGISFFAEGFYSERRSEELYTPGASPAQQQALAAVVVPTINPYYPSGAPSGLRVSYNLAVERDSLMNAGETAARYAFGFNAILPYGWFGKVYYSTSIDNGYENVTGMLNANNVSAALGNTVSVAPGTINPNDSGYTYTKPANVPYLNLFCDATKFQCNSPATLAYMGAYRYYTTRWKTNEIGLNFDGPLFDLPGGPVKAAVGFNRYGNDSLYLQNTNFNTASNTIVSYAPDYESYNDWAVYGQLDIPVISEANKLPLVEALSFEASYRYDDYNLFGNVAVPKVSGSWTIADGLTLRGNWGKGYRAPVPGEFSPINGATIEPFSIVAGASQDDPRILLNCPAVRNLPGGVANPGSLNALLNPTCSASAALVAPGVLQIGGGSGAAGPVRSGTGISPEKSQNWNLGVNFTPTDPYLKGFTADVVWYHLTINGYINTNGNAVLNPNDPLGTVCTVPGSGGCVYYVKPNLNAPITDPSNSAFYNAVTSLAGNPRAQPISVANVVAIWDTADTNTGFQEWSGIDFDTRYDFDLGALGAWNAGITGNYQLTQNSSVQLGTPTISFFNGLNSGGRLHYRARLGWMGTEGMADGLSVTGFMNFIPHSPTPDTGYTGGGNLPPTCFWQTGAAMPCYPGAPAYGPYSTYPGGTPGLYTFDISVGYTTGTRPANPYLQNVSFQFTVLDLLDKAPPFQYNLASGRSAAAQIANGYGISPLQRFINIAITKSW